MQPEQSLGGAANSGSLVCAQCGAPMPLGMRFCRSCGNRLGEGPAEYTETVRLGSAPSPGRMTSPFTPGMSAPIANRPTGFMRKRRLGFTGMTWVWIGLGLFFASGGLMSAFVKNIPRASRPAIIASSHRAMVGVNGWQNSNGGVTFDYTKPPGGPADKAGLAGGDIITSIDGHVIKNEDDAKAALSTTLIGKAVEVLFLRDGEPKKTMLTPISQDQLDELGEIYDSRSGRGMFGYDNDRTDRVQVPDTKMYGVRLNKLEEGEPAERAGIKEGDIVIQFGDTPIRTEEEFLSRVRRAEPYSTVKITVMRDGQKLEIPVNLGRN